MNTTEFYQALLESAGLIVSEAGHVLQPTKSEDPIQVDGKDLVLPTKFYLDQNEWSEVHPFHPLCEDALMGQSPTFHILANIIRISLSQRFAALIKDVLTVGVTKELQQQVRDPSANEILAAFPDVKSGAIKSWATVYGTFAAGKHFASIYIARNKDFEGKQHQRVGETTFHVLEGDSDNSLLGAVIPKKDTAGIRALVTKVLETIPTTYGSNASVPYLDVLLRYYIEMAKRYNEIVTQFGAVITAKPIDMEWVEGFEDIERLRKRIPKLPGNAGVRSESDMVQKKKVDVEEKDNDAFSKIKTPKARASIKDMAPPWDEEDEPKRNTRSGRRPVEDVRPASGSIKDILHSKSDVEERYERSSGRSRARDTLFGGRRNTRVAPKDNGRGKAFSIRDV